MTKTLTDDQMTLQAYVPSQRMMFEQWDERRDVITFYDGLRPSAYLPEQWEEFPALTQSGVQVTLRVRAADCDASCFCAGEYEIVQVGFSKYLQDIFGLLDTPIEV